MTYNATMLATPGSIRGYRLASVIGAGGTAEVRLAWRFGEEADRPVAIKRLQPAFADDPDAAACLRHEVQVLRGIRHPSIVQMLDGETGDGPPFLVMELLGGGSLQELSRARTPLPAAGVASLLGGVADALGWLHGRGITHADVKPANLLRDTAGRVKLIDFGIAQRTGSAAGFVASAYASPERLLGLTSDPRDDVFSLAVVIYELLTSRHPFGDDPVLAIGVPERPVGLPAAGWEVLLSALAPARADRPRDPSLVLTALGA